MINYNWNYPTSMWVGKGRVNDLSKACNELNIKKPLLVTDKELIKTNMFLDPSTLFQISPFCSTVTNID